MQSRMARLKRDHMLDACLSRTHEQEFRRRIEERMRGVTMTNAESASIRYARGENFAYVHGGLHSGNLSMHVCACIKGLPDSVLTALQTFYRRVLKDPQFYQAAVQLPTRFDFNLVLRDADMGWRRCCSAADPRLLKAPPPLAPAAYEDEHALAFPTFNSDVDGWSFESKPVLTANELPAWNKRRPQLVWRGSNGPLNSHPSREGLLRAGVLHPHLIDAKEPKPNLYGGRPLHFLNWTEQAWGT